MDNVYLINYNENLQDTNMDNPHEYNITGFTDTEIKLMIPVLLIFSCFLPIVYCLDACNILDYCKFKSKTYLTEIQYDESISDNCPICLEGYNIKDKLIKLDCSHIFHKKCIYNWFKRRIDKSEELNCPMCRNNFIR